MPVFYCPWCGSPVAGKRDETSAVAARSARAPLTPRSFRNVVSAGDQPIQLPALRPERLGSAPDNSTGLGGSENAWVVEVREKIAGARGLRAHIEDRYTSAALFEGRWYSDADILRDGRPIDGAIPSPDSEDRTPYLRRDTSDGMIDRIIFGVFFALGLLATIRFILTH